jgi:aspartate-semialdehyde dehydrogenase
MIDSYRVAVVGATGVVGQTVLKVLEERGFPVSELVPFASQRSMGKTIHFRGQDLPCQILATEAIEGFDLVFSSAGGDISRDWMPRFAEHGATVIDKSSFYRMQSDVPLVVPEVNPEALSDWQGGAIISSPNCSTTQLVVALKPIYKAAGIERLVISTYQAVSGTGKAAVDELLDQSHALLHERRIEPPSAYEHQIAFNVLPQAGSFVPGEDYTDEEQKLVDETRKILNDATIRVSATCVRVPVQTGHSEAVNVQTRNPLSPEQARELLSAAPGVVVVDDPTHSAYPLATDAAGKDDVFVGRIRRDPGHDHALNLWIVADNLRKGAATNAVQIAELLHEHNRLRSKHLLSADRQPVHA